MVSAWPSRRLGGADRRRCSRASWCSFSATTRRPIASSIRQILNHSALKELDRDGTLFTEENIASLSGVIARALPAAFAIVWLTITLFNLWMAGLIVDASGRALRPWPDLHALELPNAFVLVFAGALAASFLPGLPGLLATGLAGALLFAYVLQGLAVIHVYSRGVPLRGLAARDRLSRHSAAGLGGPHRRHSSAWPSLCSACASAPTAAAIPPTTTETI